MCTIGYQQREERVSLWKTAKCIQIIQVIAINKLLCKKKFPEAAEGRISVLVGPSFAVPVEIGTSA